MTDFLGRVAARAVGASAAAQPRLSGLFEPAEAGPFEVHEEVVVTAPATSTPAAAPAARDTVWDRQAVPAGAQPPVAAALTPVPPTPPPREAEATQAPPPVPADVPPTVGRLQPAVPPLPSRAAARSAPAVAVAAAPLAQARPARPVLGPSNGPSLDALAAPVREEPPPVRVHIGRLEVRANVPEPPREPPRREPSRPEGLSLADYLRGQREVRP